MGKAAEKLDAIRKEKEKIEEINKTLGPKKSFFSFLRRKPANQAKINAPENKNTISHRAEKKHEKKSSAERRRFFLQLISIAGIEKSYDEINKTILHFAFLFSGLLSAVLIVDFLINKSFVKDAALMLGSVLIFGTLIVYLVGWGAFFVFVDLRIYQRRKEIEAVFPDFLQLTAANINAGMPIDRALWFAIRPRFGILAKEMERVAKATMVGESLPKALIDFSEKYDSVSVKRSLNLLLVGLDSGGEIGDLLSRVADNMRETEIIKKEMAASVTTYVIFILFATLGAAPFLFGLTTELIVIMKSILSGINLGGQGGGGGGMSLFTISPDAISLSDYRIFAITSICVSSIFAAIIISVIQKGNAKESLKQIPFYIGIGLSVYLVAYSLLHLMLGGFFN